MSRRVILKSLSLENFKGRTMSFDFPDGKVVMRGTNEAGKSTLTNAFFWLLMGVDASDRSNYELYDTTLDFCVENAIPAVVEGVFEVDSVECVFKRQATQKWVRKRGKAEYEKASSDDYAFFVDGLSVSAGVYKERIESLFAPVNKLKLMLNVRYYQTLDWKSLRKHFSEMVGVISDSELEGDYSAIADLLGKYEGSLEKVKKYLKQLKVPIDEEAASIKAEITGMKNMLPTLDGVEQAEEEYCKIKLRIDEIDKEIVGLGEANKPLIMKRKAELLSIEEKKSILEKERVDWNLAQTDTIAELHLKLDNIRKENQAIGEENNRLKRQRAVLDEDIERDSQHLDFLKEELDRLRKENAKIKAREFDENQVCPSCGQPLPAGKVADIRERFFDQREKDHKAIVEQGLKVKAQSERIEESIKAKKEQRSAIPSDTPFFDASDIHAQLSLAEQSIRPFEESQAFASLTKEISEMESKLTEIPSVDSEGLIAEKKRLNDEVSALLSVIDRRVQRTKGKKLIAIKEKEQSMLRVEQARLEGLLSVCASREREWASIVRNRANKYLAYSQVEMLETTKAGELVDVCSLTARDVPSGSQNNATQIRIGIDLAQAFQKNVGIELPIFVDNAEGIVDKNMPDIDNQMVLLYVDDKYRELTIC